MHAVSVYNTYTRESSVLSVHTTDKEQIALAKLDRPRVKQT